MGQTDKQTDRWQKTDTDSQHITVRTRISKYKIQNLLKLFLAYFKVTKSKSNKIFSIHFFYKKIKEKFNSHYHNWIITSKHFFKISWAYLEYISMSVVSTSLSQYTLSASWKYSRTRWRGVFMLSAFENSIPWKRKTVRHISYSYTLYNLLAL